jgi:hypothetical protein
VYVPQGTFAASKDETRSGPTWTRNLYITHTHKKQVGAPETMRQSQIRFNYKAPQTKNRGHVDGNVSSSVSCNLQMS